MRIEARRFPDGLCMECSSYELITRMGDDSLEPLLDLDEGWCAEMDCLVRGDHFPCERWELNGS